MSVRVAILIFSAFSFLAGCAALPPFVEKETPDALIVKLEKDFRLWLPDGPGPYPMVIGVHGCARRHQNIEVYAERANELGIAFMEIDSNAPRGRDYETALRRVCFGRALWGSERAGDVLVAIEYARRLGPIDSSRIGLMGWSHGAWTLMDLMSMNLEDELPFNLIEPPEARLSGVAAQMLFYPYCGFGSRTRREGWDQFIPTRIILVKDDFISDPKQCLRAIEKVRKQGAEIELSIYEGVTHAFDEEQLPGSRIQYDEEAAKRALQEYDLFLEVVLDEQPDRLELTPKEIMSE